MVTDVERKMKKESSVFPASFAQQRLWFLDQLEPNSPAYNVTRGVRLKGRLDIDALQQSLEEIVRRHQALRTTIATRDGQPVQVISPCALVSLPVIDVSNGSTAEREEEILRLAHQEAQRPFELSRGPLLRVALLRADKQDHLLVVTMHHIVSDGWSMAVLFRELSALYQAFSTGEPSPLAELPVQYVDYTVWQRNWLKGEVLQTQLSYWKKQLDRVPTLQLPTDRPRPPVRSYRGARQSLVLPKELTEGLKALSRKAGVTLFMTLLSALQTLLHRYTGQEDVTVGTPIAGRTRAEFEGLIGFLVNTLVLRGDLSGNPTFRELLARVRAVALDAYDHQDVPFEKLVEELHPDRDLSSTPLFQVMFAFQNVPHQSTEFRGIGAAPVDVDRQTAKFDLSLATWDEPDGLKGAIHYNTDLFDSATIERMSAHFQALLAAIVADPDRRLGELPVLREHERHRLLVEWNDTRADYPQNKCVHELFEDQVQSNPEAIAVVFDDRQLTYEELDQRANRLAHHLRGLGAGAETLIAICMERSIEMLIGLLGILKAGGAYVPLDPAYPKDRLGFMLQDSQVRLLLTQKHLLSRLPDHNFTALCLDEIPTLFGPLSEQKPETQVTADNPAYVIYTSGSTGKPKGVMIEHRSLVNYLYWFNKGPLGKQIAHPPAISNLSFDASLKQLFAPLLMGGQVWILADRTVSEPASLLGAFKGRARVSVNCVPSLWSGVLEAIDASTISPERDFLATLLLGGEASSSQLLKRTFELFPGIQLWNLYGPTEATANTTFSRIEDDGSCPIGRPVANAQVYILDRYRSPAPVGVAGELYIGGDGLARGYLNHPDLTAEKFVPNPFSGKPGARLYRTGDLARYRGDGNIEFLGRIDQQVKIRGFRIELGEIESVLGQHAAVREGLVLAREDIPGDKRLVAYVVPSQDPAASAQELRGFLMHELPDYMLPSSFVFLDSLPLTANGKIDRRALPPPEQTRPELEETYAAPRTPVEELLAGIWAEVLKLERIGIHDNFFDLGGHSLKATQAMSRLCEAFHVEMPLRSLFEHPTVAGLAARISQNRTEEPEYLASMLDELEVFSDDKTRRLLADDQG